MSFKMLNHKVVKILLEGQLVDPEGPFLLFQLSHNTEPLLNLHRMMFFGYT